MYQAYKDDYERRKREMDSPQWESQRKAYLEQYFHLWPKIEKIGLLEFFPLLSIEEKETYPDHSPRITPDLDALLDFLLFLSEQNYGHEWLQHPVHWCFYIYKIIS